jgi:predicted dehydrogenase
MKTVRWGIIGCGDVTEKKSGPAFSLAENSTLVAVMRRDAEKAADYAARHKVARWYSDADELIQDPEVNAVYIATPPASHMEYTLKAAEAGKPVYVEKPMALSSDQCGRMIEVCRKNGVPLFVAYYRRALPRFLKVKELIEEGAIGTVRGVDIRFSTSPVPEDTARVPQWRVNPEISGGGHFLDLASHTLDFLDYLFGPVREVYGRAFNQGGFYSAEDNVCALFSFDKGISGTGSWIFTVDKKTDRCDILGTEGSIRFASFADLPLVLRRGDSREKIHIPHPRHIQQPLIQSVVDDLLGRGSCPSTGESALRTSRVTDTILQSYYS